MSLSSLLLAKGSKDTELDALFKSNPAPLRKPAVPIQVPVPGSAPPAKKRKLELPLEGQKKRTKPSPNPKSSPKTTAKSVVKPTPPKAKKSKSKREAESSEESEQDVDGDEDDNSDLENAYLRNKLPGKPTARAEIREDSGSDEPDEDAAPDEDESADADSDNPDAPPPVHESLTSTTKRTRTKTVKKTKIVPEGETPVQRNARTLFVGGLPIEVAQKKALQKQLARHVLSFLPSQSKVKIESTRFRSVAFQQPSSAATLSNPSSSATPASEHSKARASAWRQADKSGENGKTEEEEEKKKEYLTPAQKRRVMFIQGAFHPEASGVNAYVVLAHHAGSVADGDGDREGGTDTPYAAALHIARAANLSVFMERQLRVDVCVSSSAAAADADGEVGATGDPKLSIFVGNLEFGAKESDVREFFEGVVAGERGPAPVSDSSDTGGRWVLGVRLIRDRETQLGKGFGYVRFVDRECVDEILALAKTDEGAKKLRFAKRGLRVQRCRASAISSNSPTKPPAGAAASALAAASSTSKSTYPTKRGDPTLGERLAHLGKEERKAAKKADVERGERRAEKKKLKGMRMRMGAPGGVGAVGRDRLQQKQRGVGGRGGSGKRDHGKSRNGGNGKGKDRERVRKTRVAGKK